MSSHNQQKKSELLIPVIIVLLLLLLGANLIVDHNDKGHVTELTSLSPSAERNGHQGTGLRPLTFDERVEKHKNETGLRINSARIQSQLNNMSAPSLSNQVTASVPKDPVLYGVPLTPESNEFLETLSSGPLLQEASFENQVQADIANEQAEAMRLKYEQEAYIQQFKANAAAMGYSVKIDKNYDVEYEPLQGGRRNPQSMSSGPKSSGGSAD